MTFFDCIAKPFVLQHVSGGIVRTCDCMFTDTPMIYATTTTTFPQAKLLNIISFCPTSYKTFSLV